MSAARARRGAPGLASPRRAARLALLLLLAAAGGRGRRAAGEDAPGPRPADAPVRLVVLHTNDVHGALLPRSPALARLDADEDVGGFAALAAVVRAERAAAAARGAHVLLVDGGDVWRGTPEGDLTRGDLVVEAFGRLGYDAVAVGNHEFDFGVENAARLGRAAKFPWIAANVREAATGATPAWMHRSVVREVGGVRVALVGLTTPDTPRIVVGGDRLGLAFLPVAQAAREEAEALRGRADVVLFVTHLGPALDAEVLRAVPTCPLVVGGHSHTMLSRPIDARGDGSGWIVQAGTGCVVVGRVELEIERGAGRVRLVRGELLPLVPSRVGKDPDMAAFLAERLAAVPELKALDAVAGTLAGPLPRVGRSPRDTSPAGHFFADATRAAAGAEVGLSNRGAIRVVLPAGPVTLRDLFLLMPFDNTVVVASLTGKQLKAVVAHSLRVGPGGAVSPLEVSGLTARFTRGGAGGGHDDGHVGGRDGGQDDGIVFTSFEVAGAPVDDDRRYRVAINSFLAGGGDGYPQLRARDGEPPHLDTGILVRDALRRALAGPAPYVPDTVSRLVETR